MVFVDQEEVQMDLEIACLRLLLESGGIAQLKEKGKTGLPPLFQALDRFEYLDCVEGSLEFLRIIVCHYREAGWSFKTTDMYGETITALEMLCRSDADSCLALDVAQEVVAACPGTVRENTESGFRVFELACARHSADMVELMLDADSTLLLDSETIRGVPAALFWAIQNGNNYEPDMIPLLINAYDEIGADLGENLLHIAGRYAASPSIVEHLLSLLPPGQLLAKDSHGLLPLECAAHNTERRAHEVFLLLLKKAPAVAKEHLHAIPGGGKFLSGIGELSGEKVNNLMIRVLKAQLGDFALHDVCKRDSVHREKDLADAELIIKTTPRAASRYDEAGMLPLHYVSSQSFDFALVELLIAAEPESPTYKTKSGNLPIHLACSASTRSHPVASLTKVVKRLTEQSPSTLQVTNKDGLRPMQLAFKYDQSCGLDLISTILQLAPQDPISLAAALEGCELHGLIPRAKSAKACSVLKSIFDACPSLLAVREISTSNLPLHCACSKGCSAEVIRAVIAADPEALKSPNEAGQLPLHLACQHSGSVKLIHEMIEAYGGALSVTDGRGRLPFHLALSNTTNDAANIVRAVMEADPTCAVNCPPRRYALGVEAPLITACKNSKLIAEPELILRMAALHPEALKAVNHAPACPNCRTPKVRMTVKKAGSNQGRSFWNCTKKCENQFEWADSEIPTPDYTVDLPLHLVCSQATVSVQLVQGLIEMYPEALAVKLPRHGQNLPLHCACSKGCSAEVIRAIIAADPEALKSPNDAGQLPLHLACQHSGSVEVIREMIEAYGGALNVSARGNNFPLHYAVSNPHTTAANIVRAVMDADQAVVTTPASEYRSTFPIIIACKNSRLIAEPELILRLAALHPEALKSEHGNSKSLPLHLVCSQATVSVQLVQGLIEMYPEALAVKLPRHQGNLPLHCACSKGCSAEVIRAIIAADPEALKSPNDAGQLPLHLACSLTETTQRGSELIEMLVKGLPDSPFAADSNGRLPLHLACMLAFVAALEFLVKAAPGTLLVRDAKGLQPIHMINCQTPGVERKLPQMLQGLLSPPFGAQALICCKDSSDPGASTKGATLASLYASHSGPFSEAFCHHFIPPHKSIMESFLQAAPGAVWTIICSIDGKETCHSHLRGPVSQVRYACEAAWNLQWVASSHIHRHMPSRFKRAVLILLMAKLRRNASLNLVGSSECCYLSLLPHDITLRIAKWLASMFVQPPYLRQSWAAAQRAIKGEMHDSNHQSLSAAAQALAKGDFEVTAEELGIEFGTCV